MRAPTMTKLPGICMLLLIVGGVFVETHAQVTFERLVNSSKEPQNWLTYSGNYAGRRLVFWIR